jgi:DNA repair and recombination protein RAD52
MFTPEQIKELNAPLVRSHVKERKQAGRALSYIEGWHAIAEANRIFGFGDWTRETLEMRCVSEQQRTIGQQQKPGWGVSYVAKVRVTVHGVVREGYGTGHGIDADLGLAHESAIKEAETDAMKRALMTFGNPFGLALYDKEQANVCETPRQSFAAIFIDALHLAQTVDELTEWAKNTKPSIVKLHEDDQAAIRDAYAAHRTKLAEAEYQKEAAE